MGKEIEKKFLLRENKKDYITKEFISFYGNSLNQLKKIVLINGTPIQEGYLSLNYIPEFSSKFKEKINFNPVEARLRKKGNNFYFTVKGEGTLSRNELEIELDKRDFNKFWNKTKSRRIEKIRLCLPYKNYKSEIDVYTDRDLIVLEIEVPSIKEANLIKPLGLDVTENPKYKNKNLAEKTTD